MIRATRQPGVLAALVLTFAFAGPRSLRAQASHPAPAQAGPAADARLAPIDRYLIPDRDAEIALARSAAPEKISHDATILVLGRHGYETAAQGTNGFVCLVERGWMGPLDGMTFSTKIRGPLCLNPEAVRFVLPIDYKRTEQVLAGRSKDQIIEWTKAAYARKELPEFVPGAMAYMMSKAASLTDDGDNLAHLMFYTPVLSGAEWGADVPHSPVIYFQKGSTEPFNIFLVPVGKWSDGTPAPLPH